MRLSATGALKTRSDAKKLTGFGKMWEPGDAGIVFYPVYRDEETDAWELLVGGIWGHPADPNAIGLKTVFIPSLTDINASGDPVNIKDGVEEPCKPDVTYQFSRIAKAFIDGEKEEKLRKAAAKPWPNDAAKKEALDKVEKEFDTDSNPKAKKAVVGRIKFLITTEVVYVPLENDVPQPDKARLVTQELSDERIRKLMTILNTTKYAPEDTDGWLEVQYSFPTGNKMQAGKTDPVGQVPEYRMKVKYPEQFKSVESLLQQLPDSSETIAHRNFSYRKFSERQILNALTTYSMMNVEFLEKLNEDGTEQLIKNAEIMDRLSIISALTNEELRGKLDAQLKESLADSIESQLPEGEEPTFQNEAPTLEEMLQNKHLADADFIEGLSADVPLN